MLAAATVKISSAFYQYTGLRFECAISGRAKLRVPVRQLSQPVRRRRQVIIELRHSRSVIEGIALRSRLSETVQRRSEEAIWRAWRVVGIIAHLPKQGLNIARDRGINPGGESIAEDLAGKLILLE
jgi:hypothetical protein